MTQENVDTVLRSADALSRGDLTALRNDSTEDSVFLPARSALHGGYRGEEGLRAFLADNAETFEVFVVHFDEVRDFGDRVLAVGSLRVRPLGGGPETDIPAAVVYTFEDGKMARVEDFRERDRALEALGLAE
jgi:ketosteroid isomerase-like protein